MSEAMVSGLLYIDRLVSITDNVMHLAHLVKQVRADQIYSFLTKISCSLPGKTGKGSFMVN